MERWWQIVSTVILAVLLIATLWVYWPGLSGPLLLDDIPNLNRLQHIGPVDDLDAFLRFILSSSSTYPVRPLSFASFLINDIAWPLYVPAHKYTSLLIHLINGTLVFWLSLLLCRSTNRNSRESSCIALSVTALWMLAPLQVSTILYVIQRMTSLAALFTLCGLITYCYARQHLNERPVSALVWMTSGLVFFGILGFLCKQNAVLLTLHILVVEHTLLKAHLPVHDATVRRQFRLWQWIFLVAPILLVFTTLILRGVFDGYISRPFTAFERIASQPRILFDYLHNLLVPTRQGMGVFHDDFALSTGLLSPPTTIAAIIALLAATAAALWLTRRATTLFGFAVLWFVAGHVLESSFIALEPYFEHRNYLPAYGPLFALSYFVWMNRTRVSRYLKVGLGVYLAFFGMITKQNVDIWSSQILMAEIWARDHPTSVRAQAYRADIAYRTGNDDPAHDILETIAARQPDSMASRLQILWSACLSQPDSVNQYFKQTITEVRNTHFDYASIPTLIKLKDNHQERCPKLSTDELLQLIDTVRKHKSVSVRAHAVADLLYVRAAILARENQPQKAVSHLYAAFDRNPTYDIGLKAVQYLYSLGEYRAAFQALEDVRAVELAPFDSDNFRSGEVESWQDRIHEKLETEESSLRKDDRDQKRFSPQHRLDTSLPGPTRKEAEQSSPRGETAGVTGNNDMIPTR